MSLAAAVRLAAAAVAAAKRVVPSPKVPTTFSSFKRSRYKYSTRTSIAGERRKGRAHNLRAAAVVVLHQADSRGGGGQEALGGLFIWDTIPLIKKRCRNATAMQSRQRSLANTSATSIVTCVCLRIKRCVLRCEFLQRTASHQRFDLVPSGTAAPTLPGFYSGNQLACLASCEHKRYRYPPNTSTCSLFLSPTVSTKYRVGLVTSSAFSPSSSPHTPPPVSL